MARQFLLAMLNGDFKTMFPLLCQHSQQFFAHTIAERAHVADNTAMVLLQDPVLQQSMGTAMQAEFAKKFDPGQLNVMKQQAASAQYETVEQGGQATVKVHLTPHFTPQVVLFLEDGQWKVGYEETFGHPASGQKGGVETALR